MKAAIVAVVLLVLSGVAIAFSRPPVAAIAADVKERSDLYPLPPAEVLPALSMGYRAALADYIWAHVLVTQGLRMGERRPFDHIFLYLDAINTLDPKFREPYRLADTLTSFQVGDPNREASIRGARRVLERGLRERPVDAELWLVYGQFLTYIGPGGITDEKEQAVWRKEGAFALARAAELAGNEERFMYSSLPAAKMLALAGEEEAAIQFMERAYAMTEDEEIREKLEGWILSLNKDRKKSRMLRLSKSFDRVWGERSPWLRRSEVSVIGPPVDPWKCVGPPTAQDSGTLCTRDWRAWTKAVLQDD